MAWDNSRGRGGHHRGRKWKHHNDGRSNNDQEDDGDQKYQKDQENQQSKPKQENQQNQQNKPKQRDRESRESGNSHQNGKSTNNGSKDSNAKIDWNRNGWVGASHSPGKGKNVHHCCFWQEVSQDPYLRQIYGHVSQFLADNKKAFCASSPPEKSDVIMAEARQDKSAWQEKVEKDPKASMLLDTDAGRFISKALHGYFEPCMNVEALNETYMIVQQEPNAPGSGFVGKYMVHSRNPILPNGPKDLFVQMRIELNPKKVEMLISPCDTNGFNFEGPVGVMKKYRKELTTPIDGYTVTGELDTSLNGMYLSLIMEQAERAWELIYSFLVQCPK